jgi:hypothetical protein
MNCNFWYGGGFPMSYQPIDRWTLRADYGMVQTMKVIAKIVTRQATACLVCDTFYAKRNSPRADAFSGDRRIFWKNS